MDVFMLKK